MNENYITIIDGVKHLDTRILAVRVNLNHDELFERLLRYQSCIENYSHPIRFDLITKAKKGGKPVRFALLDGVQMGLLTLLCPNTDQILEFKKTSFQLFLDEWNKGNHHMLHVCFEFLQEVYDVENPKKRAEAKPKDRKTAVTPRKLQ